uniref:Peptidase A1 domain-containing protein n=1 Tax=Ananas comosus var. bracteatus TaxID=296719 RepID=A0A6V7NWF4_ANACO|nr:unnamed protein product [Ananas comosus var. bracteatus]
MHGFSTFACNLLLRLPSSSLLLLLLALGFTNEHFHVARAELERRHTVDVRSLLPNDVCSSIQGHKGPITEPKLKLIHRHGPCSPLMHRQSAPSHNQILAEDQSRVNWLHRRTSAAARHSNKRRGPLTLDASMIPAHTGDSLGTGNYIVTVGFGTPKKDFSVIFDTGSDVTWIQCQPCVSYCYPQQDPLFDPAQSSTYANISCSSPYCSALDVSGCSASNCLYGVQYGDNSYTVGFFAQDTLTLTPADVIPKFKFGCGEKNRGLFGQTAGLLGLGREQVSLVSQTYQRYGGKFAYCLPSTSSSTGYLTFGEDYPTANVKFTPMLSDPSTPTFYYLSLVGISVAGQQLSILPSVFSTAGTIIDSGTVISRLQPDAYSALRSAFRKHMSAYKPAPALSILDTCYDLSGESKVIIPTVALQFAGGTEMNLDVSGILYVASASQSCLAFAANGDPSDIAIIGNVQQRRFNVVYDVSKNVIGFGPGAC